MIPLRVVLATPYDLAVPGGVNRHTLDLLDALTEKGVDARLIGPSSASFRVGDPRIILAGSIWTRAFNGARTRITLDWRVVGRLRRLFREFRPDVLHVQEPVAPLPCAAALWLVPRGTLRVGTFHTYSETSRGYLWSWPWFQSVWSSLDVRVAVSEAAREFACRYHRGACSIVPHAVRLPPTGELRPMRALGTPARLLFVGRMDEPRKGFSIMLEALKQLHAEQPGAYHLTALGPGADPWRGLTGTLPVIFRGEVDDCELSRAYGESDLLCLPSTGGESFGLVAIEALAHRLPVIASRIRGYAEWMGRSAASTLIPPGDAAALASAIRANCASAERHAASARLAGELAESYDWKKRAEEWLSIYQCKR